MRLLIPILLLAALALVLGQSLGGEFVYDDKLLIQRNPALRSLANWPDFFGSAYWDFTAPEYSERVGYWRPLSAVLLAIGHAISDGQPFGFRLMSLLVHAAATCAGFALALRLGLPLIGATLAAALFAVHPVQAEAVAWPSAINDPAFALCAFLTLERWAAWRQGGSRGLPIGAALAYGAGLLVKEPAIVVAAALPLYDLLFGVRDAQGEPVTSLRSRLSGLILGAALIAPWFAARVAVFGDLTGGIGRTTTVLEFDTSRRMLLRLEVLGDSLGQVLAPVDTRVFRPIDPQRGWFEFETFLEFGALALVVGIGLYAFRTRRPLAAFGAALMLLPILPLIGRLDSLGQFAVTDRYLVVPVFGLGLVLADLVRSAPRAGQIAVVAGALALGFVTRTRVPIWLDEETLFRTAAAEAPESALLRWSYGRTLLQRFGKQREKDIDLLNAAQAEFLAAQDQALLAQKGEERALVGRFDLVQANVGLALTYLEAAPLEGFDDYETPKTMFERVLDTYPDQPTAWEGLGRTRFAVGELEPAREAFERATELDPTAASAHKGIGLVYYHAGRMTQALESFERVLELRSGNPEDLLWAARAALDAGRRVRGEELVETALAVDPTNDEALVLRAEAALRGQDPERALQAADDALLQNPRSSLAHSARGKALVALGDRENALLAFTRACENGPELFEPHYNVASLLLERGAIEAATPYLERAYRLCNDAGLRTTMRGALANGVADRPETLLSLAEIDAARGDLRPALDWARAAEALAPENVEVLRTLAAVHMNRDEPDAATDVLTRADALAPDVFGIVRELAYAALAASRYDAARSAFERALALLPPADRLPGGEDMRTQLETQLREGLESVPVGPTPQRRSDSSGD